MGFSERDKAIALAIVKIFETGKPLGDYSAVAVLNDGAGISYGTSQFTHRSGSLALVINRYLSLGGTVGADVMRQHIPLAQRPLDLIGRDSNPRLKVALAHAGKTPEMRQAQREIAFEKYLNPALQACEGSDFETPMALAVIYDSMNHGSYKLIRDNVVVQVPGNGSIKPIEFEKEWIKQYVRKRHGWLRSIPRLRATSYRTQFFLNQITLGNWELTLPINVNGYNLTESTLLPKSAAGPAVNPATNAGESQQPNSPLTPIPQISPSPATEDEGTVAKEITSTQTEPTASGGEKTISATVTQPVGDAPDAEPSFFVTLEDWKGKILSRMKWVTGLFGTLNTGNVSANFFAAIQDPDRWYIYLAIGAAILILSGVCFSIIMAGLLIFWLWNRREISSVFRQQNLLRADPNMKNMGVEIEKM